MQGRRIWSVRPISECIEKTGQDPVSVRWVDTDKGGPGQVLVRSRLVARDFKGGDKDRDDLFAETPPEAKRLLISRAATQRKDGRWRKLMFVDVKKAHLNPKCEEEVYIELPEECKAPIGTCGYMDFAKQLQPGRIVALFFTTRRRIFPWRFMEMTLRFAGWGRI